MVGVVDQGEALVQDNDKVSKSEKSRRIRMRLYTNLKMAKMILTGKLIEFAIRLHFLGF